MCDDTVMNVGNTAKARKNFDDPQEGRVTTQKALRQQYALVGGVNT